MALLRFINVSLSLGGPALLDRASFYIDRGERLCLIGRNGAGKSSLLKLTANEMAPDAGEIASAPGLRVARLAQDVPHAESTRVRTAVAAGLGDASALLERYHTLSQRLANGDHRLLAELERCQQALEAAGGWALDTRVEATLSRLGLTSIAEQSMSQLSGGLKRRVMLARALVSDADLLLLDEPTNHLDIDTIRWLEEFLLGFGGALLFVSHDRAFIRRLATRIIELDRGQLRDFPGDYAAYLRRKEALLANEDTRNALFDKTLAQEEAWIRQGVRARRTRNEGRVHALERLRAERAARRVRERDARIALQDAERSGKIVAEADNVDFSYGGDTIIRHLNTVILRGDKVGVIGPNGAGKTTLLRLLLGELEPTRGHLGRGTHLKVSYFDQYRAALEEDKTVQDNVGEGRDVVTIDGQPRHVLGYLQDFLFTPERARQPVKSLSGGERNRLLLAKLFTRPANVLVLDEPTNDLDADTLELLEALLTDYRGTLLLVSHDRAFLNNVVTSTLAFEGDGVFKEYVGGYDDWLRQRATDARAAGVAPKKRETEPARGTTPKLSYKEQRELEALPTRIEALERERDSVHASMAAPQFYHQEGSAIAAAQARLGKLEHELANAYARWEQLESARG